ncbi:hypothetical protein FRC18_005972, partial [Serendipita sp. 400]
MESCVDSLSISNVSTAIDTPTLLPLSLQPSEEDLKAESVAPIVTNTANTLAANPSPLQGVNSTEFANASTSRKLALLFIFTLANFLDGFNISALIPAIPGIASQLQFQTSEITWIIACYQLTFAAFLLF